MLRIPLLLFLLASLLAPALMEYHWCHVNAWSSAVMYRRIVPEQLFAGLGNALPAMLLARLMWRRLGDVRIPVGIRWAMLLLTLTPVLWFVADCDLYDYFYGEYATGGLTCFTGVPIFGGLLALILVRLCAFWESLRSAGAQKPDANAELPTH